MQAKFESAIKPVTLLWFLLYLLSSNFTFVVAIPFLIHFFKAETFLASLLFSFGECLLVGWVFQFGSGNWHETSFFLLVNILQLIKYFMSFTFLILAWSKEQ